MRAASVVMVVVVVMTAGCAGTEIQVNWKVKDPRLVAVKRAGNVVLATTATSATDGPVQLERAADGAVSLRCATCRFLPFKQLVAADGTGVAGYTNDPAREVETQRANPDFDYAMSFTVDASYEAGPTLVTSARTSYDIALSTPWANVQQVRADRRVLPWNTATQILIGVALTAFGAYLVSDDTTTNVLIAYPSVIAGAALTLHGGWVALTGTKSWNVYP